MISPSLDSTLQRSVSRLDLHRSTSANRSQNTRRATSLTNVNSANLSVYKPTRPSKFQNAVYGSRKGSLSKQYERRYLDGDISEKHFHFFNQPTEPFQPRLLLFNVAESRIAQQPKHYQPPFWKMRLQHLRNAKLGIADDATHGRESAGHGERTGSPYGAEDDELLSPLEKERSHLQSSPSVTFRLGRGRISPNTLGHLSPTMARTLLFERSYVYK